MLSKLNSDQKSKLDDYQKKLNEFKVKYFNLKNKKCRK
jgi:hypothetical protein